VKTYTIGEIAEEFGLTLRTLRFYETRGLLTPERRGQARMYTDADRKRIREVVAMKKLGFSVREIGSGEFSPEKFAEQLALVRQQRAELDKVIAVLAKKSGASGEVCEPADAQLDLNDHGASFDPPPDDRSPSADEDLADQGYRPTVRDWLAARVRVPDQLDPALIEELLGRRVPAKAAGALEVARFRAEGEAAYRYMHADATLRARRRDYGSQESSR
jgi:DNA-binding transcriptional MerR regulator